MSTSPDTAARPDWIGVAIYFVVACAISVPLILWRDLDPAGWRSSPIPSWLRPLIAGWGPAVGAVVAMAVRGRHHVRTITFAGTSHVGAALAVLLPIVILAAIAPASTTASPHLLGAVAGFHAFTYALGEELGWRGYLQDALRPLPPIGRYALLGTLWGIWHATTFAGNGSATTVVVRLALFYVVLVAASAGIGAAADRTRSVLVAAACHLFYTFPMMLGGRDRWLALGLLVPAVIVLVHWWPGERRAPAPHTAVTN